jgi:Zn-dependent protease with chaperone function
VRFVSKLTKVENSQQWGKALFFFAFPSLLLLMTCLTIVLMGDHGEMWGIKASKLSYYFSLSYLAVALTLLLNSLISLSQSRQLIKQYPSQIINNQEIKILDSSFPYAAQIGFWRSQLVLSTGLIELLSPEHLNAVIAHETAHQTYKDPFFFFWLFYLKKLTFWLPNNQQLWQNLLLLRELRADQTAAKQVDFLLIAESLITVTLATNKQKESLQLSSQCPFYDNRLEVRIDNLLTENYQIRFTWWQIIWLILIFIPYSFLPFHSSC